MRVRVNEKYACPAIDTVEPRQSVTVKLFDCTASDGERFQPLRTAPVQIAVTAVQVDDSGDATNIFRS